MISYHEAIRQILAVARTLDSERLPLSDVLGRVTAEDTVSLEALPPFNNSAMDGYAVRAGVRSASSILPRYRVNGIIAAGDAVDDSRSTQEGEAWEIMTGAVVPPGCDAVIKVEETDRQGDMVQFGRPVTPGENVREAGEDFRQGDTVLRRGTTLFPEHLMALSALGVRTVPVIRRPSVAVLSTGAELDADARAGDGKIRNSTAPYLMAELGALGMKATFLGTVADEKNDFLRMMEGELKRGVDVVLSTGAVSMGRYDFVADALQELGAEILFHKVAIRPGKPLLFAKIGSTTFFGVPGNPVSTTVGLRFFMEPYLRTLQGHGPEVMLKATLAATAKKPRGLRCFFKASTQSDSIARSTQILKGQESFRIAPLLAANSWAILPEDGEEIPQGTEVAVVPLHSWASKGGAL